MTTAQKVIKYLAIAFAIFLIVTIISAITAALFAVSGILGLKKDIEENLNAEMAITNFENNDISTLDIEIVFTNLTIKTAEALKVETDNNNIQFKQEKQKLEIKEKNKKWFSNYEEKELILYLPEEMAFEKIKIITGAGKINIENLKTERLVFELGAGETEIQQLFVSKECDIDGGAGKLSIKEGTINDLDLDMGVGEVNLNTHLTGRNELNAGVGDLNVELQGEKENYKVQADKGIGSIKIDGKEISNGETFGNGENYIEIDGGIGNIDINFAK